MGGFRDKETHIDIQQLQIHVTLRYMYTTYAGVLWTTQPSPTVRRCQMQISHTRHRCMTELA